MFPLFIIGDSHTRLYFGSTNRSDPLVVQKEEMGPVECISETCYCYAGMTMGGFCDETATVEEKFFLGHLRGYLATKASFDNVGLVFGEVDVRWHICREVKDRTIDEALVPRLGRYAEWIKKEIAPKVAGKIILLGGIPYSRRYSEAVRHPDGALNAHARRLDELLGGVCAAHGWHHLSIFDEVLGEDGFLDPRYLNRHENECTIHLEPSMTKAIVREKLSAIWNE